MRILLFFAFLLFVLQGQAQDPWPQTTKEMKPWTRWWWLGAAVDKPNLTRELQLFEKAGFGGVEITPIYGAKSYEKKYISFLSPQWMEMLDHTVQESNRLGLGVDMNLGTGWPFGGPQISPKEAATRLFLDEHVLKQGDQLLFPLKISDTKQTHYNLQALRAYTTSGEEINLDEFIQHDRATWTAPSEVTVIALFSGKTRQQVKRAAPGGEGFTLDHLGKASVQTYFSRFDEVFSGKKLGIRAFFNDSYEVYGANWTDEFLRVFEQKKRYRLQDHLWDFTGKSENADKQARLKSDYREVTSYILATNFLEPFTRFSGQHGAVSKNQAHGSPGNLIDLYANTDIAECETFGSSYFAIPGLRRDSADIRNVDPDPMMAKFASSATNTSGKKYTSSETFTWLTEHFKTSLSQAKPEVEDLFLAGVNHVFFHGTTYSPEEVAFPGWLFYASVNFVPHNPFWGHLNGLNSYITRVQSILQTAKADHEILVYWPVWDIWNDAKGLDKPLKVHDVDEWLHPTAFYQESKLLQRLGYCFDFATDAIIERAKVVDNKIQTSAEALPYKVIYVPTSRYFSEKTFANLLKLAEQGATVIFQTLPREVPGFAHHQERKAQLDDLIAKLGFGKDQENQYARYGKGAIYLTKDVHSALDTEHLFGERIVRSGLKFARRKSVDKAYYYVVNHGKNMVDDYFRLNTEGEKYTLLDPQTGDAYNLPVKDDMIRLQIRPGYAWIVQVSGDSSNHKTFRYQENLLEEAVLSSHWKVSFVSGGPELPVARTVQQLTSWTEWGDAKANKFSGTAAYETVFELTKDHEKSYLLKLGRVAESAKVFVNGQEAGVVWAHPFELDIAKYLTSGENTLRVEVANLMANRIRDLDQRGVSWRNYHEINFVNIDYKDFDASRWQLQESGLTGPVKLYRY